MYIDEWSLKDIISTIHLRSTATILYVHYTHNFLYNENYTRVVIGCNEIPHEMVIFQLQCFNCITEVR